MHGDSDGRGQGELQSDLRRHVQGDSCGDSQSEKEGDPQRDCRRDSQSDSGRDLQGDSGGDFQGDLPRQSYRRDSRYGLCQVAGRPDVPFPSVLRVDTGADACPRAGDILRWLEDPSGAGSGPGRDPLSVSNYLVKHYVARVGLNISLASARFIAIIPLTFSEGCLSYNRR